MPGSYQQQQQQQQQQQGGGVPGHVGVSGSSGGSHQGHLRTVQHWYEGYGEARVGAHPRGTLTLGGCCWP